jgi:hypothetical protein
MRIPQHGGHDHADNQARGGGYFVVNGWEQAKVLLEHLRRRFGRNVQVHLDDRGVIDVQPYADSLKRLREDQLAVAKSQDRVAGLVRAWARECINGRYKAPLPTRMPRDHGEIIRSWLNGLGLQEIYELSKCDRFFVLHHIYGDEQIIGVRDVQHLPPLTLVFPPLVLVVDPQSAVGAGGGPKVRRCR